MKFLGALLLWMLLTAGQGEAFDHTHAEWTTLLSKQVQEGKVDYKGFLRHQKALESYISDLGRPSQSEIHSWPKEEQLAFWINAYNAYTVKLILDHYPIQSIKRIRGVWDRFQILLGGEKVTLNQIEHEILRKKFKEPRIHMALVCASKGCPPLRNEAYMATKLSEQLDDNATQFFKDPIRVRWDPQKKTLSLSPIFSWFHEDFGSPRQLIAFVKRYLPEEIARQIEEEKTHVRWLSYNWSLNE